MIGANGGNAMFKRCIVLLAAALLAAPAAAGVATIGYVDCANQSFCWDTWPEIAPIQGWHQDTAASRRYHVNIVVPDGSTFDDAKISLVGTAVAKTRDDRPESLTLDQFIQDDIAASRKHSQGVIITEIEPLPDADGNKLRTFSFTGLRDGHRQIVVYAEDDEYCATLTMDSTDEALFQANLEKFKAMVKGYKR
jgi:hypothetical protein